MSEFIMSTKRKPTEKKTEKKVGPSKKKKGKIDKEKRVIQPPKYKRFTKFLHVNGLPLENVQKFEVFDLNAPKEDQMPWGKYEGEKILDLWKNIVPGGRQYLLWLYKREISHIELKEKLDELRKNEIEETGIDPIDESKD